MIYLVGAFLILVTLSLSLAASTPSVPKIISREEIDERIAYHASLCGLEPALVKAIAKVESNFNPRAKNPADPSYGLMQITPILAQDYGLVKDYRDVSALEIEKIYDINNNLSVGCQFLKKLSKYPFEQMIQSYNVGEWGFKIGRRNPDYLNKVRIAYGKFT
ncbi:hypothetical protein ES703_67338 [subsurface metagenome]